MDLRKNLWKTPSSVHQSTSLSLSQLILNMSLFNMFGVLQFYLQGYEFSGKFYKIPVNSTDDY